MAKAQPHPAHPITTSRRDRAHRNAWHRGRRRALAYGRWNPTPQIDPASARIHLHQLRLVGLSLTGISALCGQPESTLVGLLYPAGRGYRSWITPTTHAAIMRTWLDLDRLPDQQRLHAAGTVRRLQALAAIGWPLSALARELNVTPQAIHHTRSLTRVTAGKARAVRDLYARLHLTPGNSTRTARRAAHEGWLPPLAWDEETIDLPWATPYTPAHQPPAQPAPTNTRWTPGHDDLVDPVVITRALDGQPVTMNHAEWIAAIATAAARGWPDAQTAERLGVSLRTIARARAHHDIPTTWSASA